MANTITKIQQLQDSIEIPSLWVDLFSIVWHKYPDLWKQKQLKKLQNLFLRLSNRDFTNASESQLTEFEELFKHILSNQWISKPDDTKQWFEKVQAHLAKLDNEHAQPFIMSPNELLSSLKKTIWENTYTDTLPDDIQKTVVDYLLRLPDEKEKMHWAKSFSSQIIFDHLSQNHQLEQYAEFFLNCLRQDRDSFLSENKENVKQKLLVMRDIVLKHPDTFPAFVSAVLDWGSFSTPLSSFLSMDQIHDILYRCIDPTNPNTNFSPTLLKNMSSEYLRSNSLFENDIKRLKELNFFCRYTAGQQANGEEDYLHSFGHQYPDPAIWTSTSTYLHKEDFDTVAKWANAWIDKFGDDAINEKKHPLQAQASLRLLCKIFTIPELSNRLIHDKKSAERWIKFAHFIYTQYAYHVYSQQYVQGRTKKIYTTHQPFYPDHAEATVEKIVKNLWRPFLRAAQKDHSIIPMILKELPCHNIPNILNFDDFDLNTYLEILSLYPNYKINPLTPEDPSNIADDRHNHLYSWTNTVTELFDKKSHKGLPSLHTFLQNTDFSAHEDDLRFLFDYALRKENFSNEETLIRRPDWIPVLLELVAQDKHKSKWQPSVQEIITYLKQHQVPFTMDLYPALMHWLPSKEAKEIISSIIQHSSKPTGKPDQYVSLIMDIFTTNKSSKKAIDILLEKTKSDEFVSCYPEYTHAIWKTLLSLPDQISKTDILNHLKQCPNLNTIAQNLIEILPSFPADFDLRKKITDHLSDFLRNQPPPRRDLANLCSVMKHLMVTKTHQESDLPPQLQLLHKMRFLNPDQARYFLSHIPSPDMQNQTDVDHLLNYDFSFYQKVFTNLVKTQNQKSNNADVDYLIPLADSLAQLFGKNYSDYLRRVLPYVSSVGAAVNFMPSGGKLWTFTDQQRASLRTWLMDNILYPVNGKLLIRPSEELKIICSKWHNLSETEFNLPYKELLTVAQSKATYDNITDPKFATEAMKANVPDDVYSYAEDFFKAAKTVPEAFSSAVKFKADNLTGYFLPRTDPRSISFGQYTDCCQYLDNAGKPCAVSSAIDPFSGCFVLEDEKHQIVAGSFVWKTNLDEGFGVCFDNVEALGGYNCKPVLNKIYEQASQYLLEQGAKIVTVGQGCSDMDLSTYPPAEQLLKQDLYNGYSDAKSIQRVLAQTDTPVSVVDQRAPFYTRPPLVAYPLDERKKIQVSFPDLPISELSHKIPLDHRTVLIDKDGYFQGFAFANPANNLISVDLNQQFYEKHPKSLEKLWRSLIGALSASSQKNWDIFIQNEQILTLIQKLKQQKLLQFDEIPEVYPCTVNISFPKIRKSTTLLQTIQGPPSDRSNSKKVLPPTITPDQNAP